MRPFVVIAVLFILAEVMLISGCVKKESPEVTNKPETTATTVAPKPTQDQAIDAYRRSHPHSLQVCFDAVNDGFMIEYSILPDGAADDGYFHGWKWIKNDHLWRAANGTWFTRIHDDSDYVNIYPDVFNLPCKKT